MTKNSAISLGHRLMVACILLCIVFASSAQQMLLGVASEGGAYGAGAIFKVNPDGSGPEVKKSLVTIAGRTPYNSLIQATNGKLYGMTFQGGGALKGVLFEYDPVALTYVVRVNFDGTELGAYPYGKPMQASNGKIYGMTSGGGANGKGVIFEYDPTSQSITKKHDFDGADGDSPMGNLIQSSDGKLYGVTPEGGVSNYGVLFNYDPQTGVFTKRKDFDGTAGTRPYGSLMIASSGKFYGMASEGGANSKGTISNGKSYSIVGWQIVWSDA